MEKKEEKATPVQNEKEAEQLKILEKKASEYDAVKSNYELLKKLAEKEKQSVTEFLSALEKNRKKLRKEELLSGCGGNEEMAEYVLGLEKSVFDNGFEELKKEIPEIKELSDLPSKVIENAKLKGSMLLDELLRYRFAEARAEAFAKTQLKKAENSSVGSQTDRKGGINPETAEFLKGLWN